MLTFFGIVLCFFLSPLTSIPDIVLWAAAALFFIGFARLVAIHPTALREVQILEQLVIVNHEAVDRIHRRWEDLPLPLPAQAPFEHLFAEDLDVVGPASLFHLLNPTPTALGSELLRSWLLDPPDSSTVEERQGAVAELSEAIEFRDRFVAYGRLAGRVGRRQTQRFSSWASSPMTAKHTNLLWALAWLIPGSFVLTSAAALYLDVDPTWVLFPSIAAWVVTGFTSKRTAEAIEKASPQSDSGLRFSSLFGLISEQKFHDESLRRRQDALSNNDSTARESLEKLERLINLADVRNSHFVHIIIQTVTLWDIHIFLRLEKWRARNGHKVEGWFANLKEFEALSAIAAVGHGHLSWTFPRFVENAREIKATGVGHPLLAPNVCVTNDLSIGPPGTLTILSGSNMSGKSTLLRALGANVVLARLGSPVCAAELVLPRKLDVVASGRIHDSLNAGVSFFMAEVQRLVSILEKIDQTGKEGTITLCLLDELLQGTNADERKVGVLRTLRRLLRLNALTVFATHDLSFRDEADVEQTCTHVHFQESVDTDSESPNLACDYKLRPGVLQSGNAIHVMNAAGLTEPT